MKRLGTWLAMGTLSIALVAVLQATILHAAPTAEQKAKLDQIESLLKKSANLFKQSKVQDAADRLNEAETKTYELADGADAELHKKLEGLVKRITLARSELEFEGVTFAPLKPLPEASTEKTKPGDKPGKGSGETSFVKQVAPILVGKCGRCHVQAARGMFSMSSYENLTKAIGGIAVIPNSPVGSKIMGMIEDGSMPPSGEKVSADEKALLVKWINEGAKFDGKDPKALLTDLDPTLKPMEAPKLTVTQATGKETVSFSKDIAGVLAESCAGCHGARNNPARQFNLNTFAGLLNGGQSGPPFEPGKGAESLLIKKLKGTGTGDRMPRGAPPLSDEVIAKVEKWINEGATFDGPAPTMRMFEVAAYSEASLATHEELTKKRLAAAEANWKKAFPEQKSDRFESANFLALGNVGQNTLKEIADRAEGLSPKLSTILGVPTGEPLIKGKFTVFVLKDRFSYSEFGKMVEERTPAKESFAHWRYTVVDAYGAMQPPKSGDFSSEALIAHQIAAAHVASQGKGVPRWFAEGCGRVVASRVAPRDPGVHQWDYALSEIMPSLTKPSEFMEGKMEEEAAAVCSYSFAKLAMTDAKKFQRLLTELRKGGEFEPTFVKTYGGPPLAMADVWYKKGPPKTRPSKPGKKTAKSE